MLLSLIDVGPIHVGAVEAIWIAATAIGVGVSALALIDAWQLHDANTLARRLVARGNIRREAFRLLVNVLLLSVIWPGLFTDREVTLTLPIVALIAAPVLLTTSSLLDYGERRALDRMHVADIEAERDGGLERLGEKVDVVDAHVQEVGEHAKAAYSEANSVNLKIDARTKAIAKGDDD